MEVWKKFENLEIVKKIWEFGEKCGNLEKKSETLEENVEVWENFRNRNFFGKLGESLEMRGKIGKIWE